MKPLHLIRRLHYLYTTERLFVYVFSGLMVYVARQYPLRSVVLLLYGLGVVAYLLFQGQRYWQLKLYRLTGRPIEQAAQLAFFRRARSISRGLIGAMPLVGLLQFLLLEGPVEATNLLLLALLANGFGILEYVNYYHRQLMLDTTADMQYLWHYKKLKVASLAKDLAEQQI